MDKKKVQQIEKVSKQVEEEQENVDIIDILLDEENKDPIVLIDAGGKRYSFEQIAVIPHNEKLYCVLKPIDKIEHVEDDEAIVFYVDEQEGREPMLMVETDEKIAMDVFEEYYNLLDEADAKSQAADDDKPKGTSSKK